MSPQHHQREASRMGFGRSAFALVVSIGVCFAAAGIGSQFTMPKLAGWYALLEKPAWTPPNWVFGPTWSALYLMMAVAAWLVWRRGRIAGARLPLLLFGSQLVLNVLWSVIFFGLECPGWAAIEIAVLWIAILGTLVSFWKRSRLAGVLLVPYLAWVSFAGCLNVAIWQMNR